jgi:hypothetical protein
MSGNELVPRAMIPILLDKSDKLKKKCKARLSKRLV